MLHAIAILIVSLFLIVNLPRTAANTNTNDVSVNNKQSSRNFALAIVELNKLTNLIYQRFEFGHRYRYQFFLGSMNFGTQTWDIMKYKFMEKLVQENSSFLMIFGGSSVTAGHDGYFNASYPAIFNKRMKPIFNALGINLRALNIAMGANQCRPYSYCYNTQGDDNADWIGWEQSFNCGRDRGVFELIARVAYFNKAVLHFSASGAFNPQECEPTTDAMAWTNEEWTPERENIPPRPLLSPADVLKHKELLNEWFVDGNPVSRFTSPLDAGYKVVGAHGFSVWGRSNKVCYNDFSNTTGCGPLDVRGPCHGGGGSHWLVRETSIYGQEGGRGASHHPPVGMHLLRGELMAYNYAYVLLDAVMTVQKDLESRTADVLATEYRSKLDALQSPEPPNRHCWRECDTPPLCYTSYEPHFNKKRYLEDIIIGNYSDAGWTKFDKGPSISNRNPEKYGFIESRPSFEAIGPNKEIHFKIVVGNAKLVHVCGYFFKESLRHAEFLLDVNAVTTPYQPSANRIKLERKTNRQYIGDECTSLFNLPVGSHLLSVNTGASVGPNHVTGVTHLVMYP